MSKKYSELLKDPRWQKRRLEALQAAGFRCQKCPASDKTLHVHHLFYVPGRMPWEYELEDLLVVCDDCHAKGHDLPVSPAMREREERRQRMRDAEAQVQARADEIAKQRAGEAPRTALEAEIADVQAQIPSAEQSGDATAVHSLLEKAVLLNRRRLGMVA